MSCAWASGASGPVFFERQGSGEPMVLLHALGASHALWRPVVGALAGEYNVVAVDLPGFGASPPLAEPSIPGLADAIEGLMDELGFDDAHLVGNSMGGWLALELGRRGRARSVVAISPAGMEMGWEVRWAQALLWSMEKGAGLGAKLAPSLTPSVAGRWLLSSGMFARPWRMDPDYLLALVHNYAEATSTTAMRRYLGDHTPQGLGEVSCPALIVWGTRDYLLPARQARRFVEQLPAGELCFLPGLGHAPMSDDPELVAEVILGFAAQAAGDTAGRSVRRHA